jgi:hypothetical protein
MHSLTIHYRLEQWIFFIFWSPNSFLVIKYFDCKIDGQLLSFCWPREKLKVGPIWKRHKKWVVHSKLAWKVQFSPLIFHIILIRSLEFVAIQFWYKKIHFYYFPIPSSRKEREISPSSGVERESHHSYNFLPPK